MTTTVSVRPSSLSDLPRIDALLARSYPILLKEAYPPSLLVTAIPLISKAQPRLIASGTYFVVEQDDQIVGAGGWTVEAPPGGQRPRRDLGHIRHVVTDHRVTRQGIGRALMDHILIDARGAGMVRMECLSTLMAVPFYEACGFVVRGPVTISLRSSIDFPAVQMDATL